MEIYSSLSQVQATHALCLWDGLGFRPPPSAAPAALCPLASCGLLWRVLRCALDPSELWNHLVLVHTGSVLSHSLQPLVHQAPLSLGLPRPFARNPSRQYSCPLGSCLAPCALQGA